MGDKAFNVRWHRWHTCSLCEQEYHGVVSCALGWAGWKTYLGRPEGDWNRGAAMNILGNGLGYAKHHEEALSVQEAELSMRRRLGDSEDNILIAQSNLASTYDALGRHQDAMRISRDVYFGNLRLEGAEHEGTLIEANNYASTLVKLERFKEAKALLRRTIPVALRVVGDSEDLTLKMRWIYAEALYEDGRATLDDLREAVTTLEDAERIARRVLGGAHPTTMGIEDHLRGALAKLLAQS